MRDTKTTTRVTEGAGRERLFFSSPAVLSLLASRGLAKKITRETVSSLINAPTAN